MSLETILNTISVSGEAELKQLRIDTEARIQEILDESEQQATARFEEARQNVLRPVSGECARRLHQAKLEALQIVGAARDEIVSTALARTRRQLIELRHEPEYSNVLRHIIVEAIGALGEEELNGSTSDHHDRPEVEVDLRDEPVLRDILHELDIDLTVSTTLNSWGGVILRSCDGRVVANNTLESRLERITPYLRQELAAFFMKHVD